MCRCQIKNREGSVKQHSQGEWETESSDFYSPIAIRSSLYQNFIGIFQIIKLIF